MPSTTESNAFVPGAYYKPGELLTAGFDIQQQLLTLQRKFWDELVNNLSPRNTQASARTILQDSDELGFYVEAN